MIRVRVRRADHVRDSIGNRHFRHVNGRLHRPGAVIQARKDVAMNVDHGNRE